MGAPGLGGAGIVGSSLTVINSGTITGGISGDGTTRADAIDFTGGNNSLTLGTTTEAYTQGTLNGDLGFSGTLSIDPGTDAGTTATLGNVIHDYADPTTGDPIAGSLIKVGVGTLDLTAANTYSGGTALDDGILELGTDSSAGTGAITFGTGAQTLQLDATGKLGNTLDDFGAGDIVDLHAITSAGAALTTTTSGGETTVTVTSTDSSDAFTVNVAPSGDQYALGSDTSGNATVVLQAVPPRGGDGGGSPSNPPGPTPFDDNLVGTGGPDTISLLAGNDTYSGLGGADLVYGNQGDDLIYGNQGDDQIFGGQGNDIAFGGQGNDTLYGNMGNDIAFGNMGDDVVYGNLGNDVLYGGQGNDTIYGGQGDDILFGNKGDDVLVGGLGSDTFGFNAGDTDFKSGVSTGDTISDFVSGTDKIDFTQGPAATAQNFGAASTTSTDFASIQTTAQGLINGGDTYAFVSDGTDGFLFTTGGSGTTIADAVKLTGATTLKATDIMNGAVA